ncbi:hypothetical protein K505DRAFT_334797 [Melanomma pulvis-pyrius CBS 109.77]|uniref:Ubiquitin-like domain-containing protein n=1 Tax=Melanomma pulvis-pyrius CBS 109.77 TaxID=1314802 RepID=A0A6A6XMT2_9PLEO|nr:hypothetical protein K505DRAFT_334797 [Melanomma pulvis-pyrius CBS 109.77]
MHGACHFAVQHLSVLSLLQLLDLDQFALPLSRCLTGKKMWPKNLVTALNATISSYGVEDGDTLFFTRAVAPQVNRTDPPPAYSQQGTLEQIQFKDVDGKTLILRNIPISMKVKDLLQLLASEKHIETEYYGFNYGGKPLKDDLSLYEYGLHKGSTIHMHMRLRGGFPF